MSRCKGVFTNTVPVDAYRGAGRPEAAYVIERAGRCRGARDRACDPAELRRRNFITPEQMPFQHRAGRDLRHAASSRGNMDDAAASAPMWPGFAARRKAARASGKLRGIGMAYYIEICRRRPDETAHDRASRRTAGSPCCIGTPDQRPGPRDGLRPDRLATASACRSRTIRDRPGRHRPDRYRRRHRRLALAAGRRCRACRRCGRARRRARARRSPRTCSRRPTADIEFERRHDSASPAPTAASAIIEVARAPDAGRGSRPRRAARSFSRRSTPSPTAATSPRSRSTPTTGVIEIVRYTVVDDFGKVMNPLLVEGQVHGGIVQGIGQALLEDAVYDRQRPAPHRLVHGLLHAARRQHAVIDFKTNEVPCTTNPLGVKGCGEAGADRRRRRPSSTRWSMRSPSSASGTSTCRRRRRRCGAPSGMGRGEIAARRRTVRYPAATSRLSIAARRRCAEFSSGQWAVTAVSGHSRRANAREPTRGEGS